MLVMNYTSKDINENIMVIAMVIMVMMYNNNNFIKTNLNTSTGKSALAVSLGLFEARAIRKLITLDS